MARPDRGPDPRLEDLFAEASELSSEERAGFLDRACAEEPDLRLELERLLELAGDADGYFEELAGAISAAGELELAHANSPKIQVGPYETLEVLGSGGMGVVYRARRSDGEFEKQVALKLLHLDMLARSSRARFLAERQILAQIEHPGIARLLDGGVTHEGRPYFVMELVEGLPITDHCRQHHLSLEQRIGLFRQVAAAVTYLHGSLIVHRDLKPSNILVTADGQVRLLDFGIAKLLGEQPLAAGMTMTGQRLLTPRYAAPEQLTGERITTATDVFGLGVLLYELLTGNLPYDRTNLDTQSIRRETTTAPSTALRTVSASDRPSAISWRRVAGDLDRICLKALRAEPHWRYASAEQLDRDLERYLHGLPVSARENTLGYRAMRFVQRHRAGVAVGLLLALLLAAGFARERQLRQSSQTAAAKAAAVSSVLGRLISSADPANARGREITVSEVIDRAEEALGDDPALIGQPAVEAEVRVVLGDTYLSLDRREAAARQFERAVELGGGLESTDETTLRAAEGLGLALRGSATVRARQILRRVVAARTEIEGADHETTLSAMSSLSRSLSLPQDAAEAEALDRHVLEQRLETLGPRDPRTLRAMNTLAGTLFYTARYEQAAAIYRQALDASRELSGPDHPDTLRLAGNLASTYSQLGSYAKAEVLLRQAVESRRRVLGNEHLETATSLHNLGMVLLRQAKYEGAASALREAMEIRIPTSVGRVYSASFLADALRESGHWKEAERLYLDVLERQKALLPEDSPDIHRTTLGLAELRRQQGQLEAAAGLAQKALTGYTAVYGEEHPQVADALLVIGLIERQRGHLESAATATKRALAVSRATLPAGHPAVIDAQIALSGVLLDAGDAATALAGLPELVEARLHRLGPEHPKSRAALELAAAASEAAAQPRKAEAYRTRLR